MFWAAQNRVGGYALLAYCIVPLIGKGASEILVRVAITTVRVLTYTGTLTMGFGLVLITRTNGFANLFGTVWGSLIITGFVITIVLLGIGDGALRPAMCLFRLTKRETLQPAAGLSSALP